MMSLYVKKHSRIEQVKFVLPDHATYHCTWTECWAIHKYIRSIKSRITLYYL